LNYSWGQVSLKVRSPTYSEAEFCPLNLALLGETGHAKCGAKTVSRDMAL